MRSFFRISLLVLVSHSTVFTANSAELDTTTVELGNQTIYLPQIDGMHRLDGKSVALDDTVAKMAEGAKNRVVALYGTEEDLGLIMKGELPLMNRTISIQSVYESEGREMPANLFDKYKMHLKQTVKSIDPAIKKTLDSIEESSSDAVTELKEIATKVEYGNVALLGIFDETWDSLSHSILAKARSRSNETEVEVVQASSICLVNINGKMLTIYASRLFDSANDLNWTRATALNVRDELLSANSAGNRSADGSIRNNQRPAKTTLLTNASKAAGLGELGELAEKGDDVAQYKVALMSVKGEGFPKNYQEAFKWATKSAEQGNTDAQYLLGLMHARGDLGEKNFVKAKEMFEKAGNAGHKEAQLNAALMHINGDGIPKDNAAGFVWMEKAAKQGDSTAQFNLAMMYAKGDGVEQNLIEADRLIRLAASQGNTRAIQTLEQADSLGAKPLKPSAVQQVLPAIRKAAENGNAEAQCNLGLMYAKGDGVPKSGEKALLWLSQSAEQNYTHAEFALGILYLTGDGIPRDVSEAAKWLRIAAKKDHPDAQFNLGLMYAKGDGVERNSIEATRLFQAAAKLGHKEASRVLKER